MENVKHEVSVDNLKDLVNAAAKIREESWSSDEPEYGRCTISLGDAAKQACAENNIDPGFARLIGLSLQDSVWNDTLAWAEE